MRRIYSSISFAVLTVAGTITSPLVPDALAARGTRGTLVSGGDVFEVPVRVKNGKKSRSVQITCLDQTPGKLRATDQGLFFQSYASEQKRITKALKPKKRGKPLAPKKIKSLRAQLNSVKQMLRAGKGACKEPDFLSLRPHTGPFGERQVRRLLEVFALGGNEALVAPLVNAGLDGAVRELTSFKTDNYSMAVMDALSCDPNPDDNERECYENGDANDFYMDGVISAVNLQSIVSINPVHMALREWVMDQRAPGNPRVLDHCHKFMYRDHLAMIDRFAMSGDYTQYVLDYVDDPFGHAKWLSGASNHIISVGNLRLGVGNEDFARELFELLLMGPNDKNGNPNYNDLDVLSGSFILSGWAETEVEDPNGNEFCPVGFFRHLHFSGPHTVFAGTPHQITIPDQGDGNGKAFVRELFRVKRKQISYELARRLWTRFVNDRATPSAVTRLATVIEENDFKLWPVMQRMMKSKAFYAAESSETIMKNPHTFLVSYARMTGIPVDDYNWMRSWFNNIGMLLGRPPTVFGFTYQNELLASDVYQMERFKSLLNITINQDREDLEEKYGWTVHGGLIAPIARTGIPEEDVVNAMLKRLNLVHSTTEAQRQEYIKFIAHYLDNCPSQSDPACFEFEGARRKLRRDVPDLGDPDGDFYRTRLLLVLLGAMRDFQTM